MTVTDQIEDFARFARSRLADGGQRSIDELYAEWRQQAFKDIDAAAIKASVRDLENGERGAAVDEFLQRFDAEQDEDRH